MDRLQLIQNILLETILSETQVKNKTRETTLEREMIHSIGCCRLAQIVALKRNLDMEISGIIGIIHDYGRIITGKNKNHAQKAIAPLHSLLLNTHHFSQKEIELITTAVGNHSSKELTQGPYDELIKDVDILENYLYGVIRDKEEYKKRLRSILTEFNLPLT